MSDKVLKTWVEVSSIKVMGEDEGSHRATVGSSHSYDLIIALLKCGTKDQNFHPFVFIKI